MTNVNIKYPNKTWHAINNEPTNQPVNQTILFLIAASSAIVYPDFG